jgi:hypothetical protein
MSILKLAKESSSDEHRIGNVFTESSYGIDRISVTLKEGVQLNTGSYVFLLDDDSYPVVYQVVQPYWFRPSFDFEESLITIGNPSADSRIQRYRCACTLVGKLTEESVSPPRNPVKPFANVYSCSPEIVAKVIHPDSDWTAKLGVNPETDRDVLIDLNTLVRQGLIVTGAQGTGKTTGLLTLVSRAMQATPSARFLLLDWTGEFASMAGRKEIKVQVINWERLATTVFENIHEKTKQIMAPLVGGKATRVFKLLAASIDECRDAEEFPTKKAIMTRAPNKAALMWAKAKKEETDATLTILQAAIDSCDEIFDKPPSLKNTTTPEEVCRRLNSLQGIVVDFSHAELGLVTDDQETKNMVATGLANAVWSRASAGMGFGCIIVTDEAHRLLPEGGSKDDIAPIWFKLATEGGRNGCPLWIVARRLALVNKTITIEAQQNMISFNTEDIDRHRIESDLGSDFAGMLGALSQGEAMVKSMGFRIPGQVVHVMFDSEIAPASPPKAKERFTRMASKDSK